jgi:hypothetical protein
MLTRTIKVICIVTIFAGLLLLSIKFKIKHLHPDTRIYSPLKSCTRINFLAPIKFCTAILRQCLRARFIYRDKISGAKSACTAIAPARHVNCTRIAKIAPCFAHYGSDGIFLIARMQSPPPFVSAPQTPFIAGPLGTRQTVPYHIPVDNLTNKFHFSNEDKYYF